MTHVIPHFAGRPHFAASYGLPIAIVQKAIPAAYGSASGASETPASTAASSGSGVAALAFKGVSVACSIPSPFTSIPHPIDPNIPSNIHPRHRRMPRV